MPGAVLGLFNRAMDRGAVRKAPSDPCGARDDGEGDVTVPDSRGAGEHADT